MNETKELRFCELVVKPCAHTYGVSPCTASGSNKCYNTPRTCQDVQNFEHGTEQVIRWAVPTIDLPVDIDAMPCITSISRRPQTVDPGEGFGVRESVTVSFHNYRHNDSGLDPYRDDRTGNAYNKGTFWGKFSARWGSMEGAEFRTVDGYAGQDLNDMHRRHYVVSASAGPDSQGNFTFTAKDVIKFFDSDTAQWPLPSKGYLLNEIDESATTLTLTPTGIGDAEYSSSGVASIGDEKVTFTRSGDIVTLTGRGLSSSSLESHDEGETFQEAAVYEGRDPAALFFLIITRATEVPIEYVDYSEWFREVNEFLGRRYSAEIMQPTPVKTLLNELIAEAGLTVYVDLEAKKLRLKVLRQEVPTVAINDDLIVASTITSKQMTSKRVSDVWIYYGKKNPLEDQDEQKNFAAIYAKLATDPVAALEDSPRAIRELYSRWITVFNADAAYSVADRLIARYQSIPRQIAFKVPNKYPLKLGSQLTIESRIFENADGENEEPFQCQITSIENADGLHTAIAEEVIFGEVEPADPDLRIISLGADVLSMNLRTAHDDLYTPIQSGQTVRLIINSEVTIGSTNSTIPCLDIGSWPAGVTIEIDGDGSIRGAGGDGVLDGVGNDGGTAIYARYNVTIIGDLLIYGGGGAGGGAHGATAESTGGGGAGYVAGYPNGTIDAGGSGTGGGIGVADGEPGDGGGPGEAGEQGFSDVDTTTNARRSSLGII